MSNHPSARARGAQLAAAAIFSLLVALPSLSFAQSGESQAPDSVDAASLLASDAEDPAEGMTPRSVDEIIAQAMQANPELRTSLLAWRQSKLSVISQDARFVPSAFGEVGYVRGRRSLEIPAGSQLLASKSLRFAAGVNQTFKTATSVGVSVELERATEDTDYLGDLGDSFGLGFVLQVAQPWLRGFGNDAVLAELHIAEIRRDAARIDQERQATTTARQVLDAYWSLWLAEQQIRINQSAMALAQQEMIRAQEQLNVGVISESELVPLMTELARIEEDLEASEAARRETQFRLASLLGQSPDQAQITPSTDPPTLPEVASEAELFAAAKERSYQLAQLKSNVEIARIQADLAENRALPDLSTSASLRLSGLGDEAGQAFSQVTGLERITGMVNLRLELPIINDAAKADAERAGIEVEIAQTNYQAALDQLHAQVASALNNFRAARARLQLAQQTAELAERQVEIQSTLFDNGTTTMIDVVSAMQQHNQARLRIERARVDILQLHIELEEATGGLLERLSVELD